MLGTAEIIKADSRHLPLADNSADLVVTSPPYHGLRSYADGGAHYDGQIGDESTPAEYIDNLLQVTRECVRVLKPTGSIFVNLGDRYGPNKSLLLLPERYRIACTDRLGLISRAVVIWSKPNGLPESVTDRVRRSHEDWVHLTRSPRYFSAVDTIREEHEHHRRDSWDRRPPAVNGVRITGNVDARCGNNPLGKLPGSVWEIPTEPLRVPDHLPQHFAAYPTEWPRRIILGWSPSGVCVACGEGRRPIAEKTATATRRDRSTSWIVGSADMRGDTSIDRVRDIGVTTSITGEACACPDTTAPTTPAVVLDPFSGTGTTALVAKALGRNAIGVDMSADYCRLAEWRTNDSGELAKAMRVEKPPKTLPGQIDLFDGAA